MASGDTKVTITNQALILLGADTISSFSDTTNDASTVANNIYETIKRSTVTTPPRGPTTARGNFLAPELKNNSNPISALILLSFSFPSASFPLALL